MPTFRKGIQIVLIEDSLAEAQLLLHALKLKKMEANLVHFLDGSEALQWLFKEDKFPHRRDDTNPRLIILDINMPKMSGLEILKKIRSHRITSLIPVVVLTSSSDSNDLQQAYAMGANAYVLKPINFNDFSTVVDQLSMFWGQTNVPPIGSA